MRACWFPLVRRSTVTQGDVSSTLRAATVLPDGSPVVAGFEYDDTGGGDFLALKLDPADGSVIWTWKVRVPCTVPTALVAGE